MSGTTSSQNPNSNKGKPKYQYLQSNQIEMIDQAIASVGDFGEVRLIVEKGRLRFLVTQRSYDVQKWQFDNSMQDLG